MMWNIIHNKSESFAKRAQPENPLCGQERKRVSTAIHHQVIKRILVNNTRTTTKKINQLDVKNSYKKYEMEFRSVPFYIRSL